MNINSKLLKAAWDGELETVRKLLALGADIHCWCYFGHSDGPLVSRKIQIVG